MSLQDRLRQLARFHRKHGLSYVHHKFGDQSMATMVAELEEAADRIDILELALHTIVGHGNITVERAKQVAADALSTSA